MASAYWRRAHGYDRMKFTKDFQADLATILAELDSGRPFAFNRFWDGELAILEERDIPTADGWSAVNVSDRFRERLRAALTYRDKDYYVGLGCPCCYRDEWERLMALAGREPDDPQVTFSTVFVNGNHGTFTASAAIKYESVGGDGDNWVNCRDVLLDTFIDQIERILKDSQNNKPFFLALGPAAKIVIHELWLRGIRRPLIDVGSALDSSGRSYHDPNHPNRQKICQWVPKTIDTNAT